MANQEAIVLDHLFKHEYITQLQALGVYRIYRLSARILNLKKVGWNIKRTYHTDAGGKRYARYALDKECPRRYV